TSSTPRPWPSTSCSRCRPSLGCSAGICPRRWPDGRPPLPVAHRRADRARGAGARVPLPVRVDALDLAEADPRALHAAADAVARAPQPGGVPGRAVWRAGLGAPPEQPGGVPGRGPAHARARAADRVSPDPPSGLGVLPARAALVAVEPALPPLHGGGSAGSTATRAARAGRTPRPEGGSGDTRSAARARA